MTTTRVTHASPAGVYAHTAERDWESDADVAADCGDTRPVQDDIALQLVHSYPGDQFKVCLLNTPHMDTKIGITSVYHGHQNHVAS